METYADKSPKDKIQLAANDVSQGRQRNHPGFLFAENRPGVVAQNKFQAAANKSPRVRQLRTMFQTSNNGPKVRQAAQLKAITNHKPVQQVPIQKREKNTGLPDTLKSGIENLAGYSMDEVKVHYNSDKPAQLNAHAFAQGNDIHLASGQERHLPHEAWHVVQQKQGRVGPTLQMKGNVNINDDAGLENEADRMGAQALKTVSKDSQLNKTGISEVTSLKKTGTGHFAPEGKGPIQRAILVGGELWGTNEDLENSPLNNDQELAAIFESIGDIEYLEEPPNSIEAAIADERFFYLWKNGDYYESDVTRFLENQGEPTDRQHQEVNTAPDIVVRKDLPQTMRIAGLISCVAVIIEAGNEEGTQELIGMHYTTGYHTDENGEVNARGTSALQAMLTLSDGYDITRVNLCYPLQVNGEPNPGTLLNLQALKNFFGNDLCLEHILGQTNVTARLDPDGTVAINV